MEPVHGIVTPLFGQDLADQLLDRGLKVSVRLLAPTLLERLRWTRSIQVGDEAM